MTNREELVNISVGARQIAGTIVFPAIAMEGVLFIHGWAGNQKQYLVRAREIAALGCVCLTFDLPSTPASCGSSAVSPTSPSPQRLPNVSTNCDVSTGWFTPRPRSAGPNRCWPISAAIPIASPSPTAG